MSDTLQNHKNPYKNHLSNFDPNSSTNIIKAPMYAKQQVYKSRQKNFSIYQNQNYQSYVSEYKVNPIVNFAMEQAMNSLYSKNNGNEGLSFVGMPYID